MDGLMARLYEREKAAKAAFSAEQLERRLRYFYT
jgi:hypothetical protein